MDAFFQNKKLFVIAGAGGVGKTTLAAALGLSLAEKGFKTLVLTVDPAKRLAQALGMDKFTQEVERVELTGKNELFASMLDSESYFDKVISKFATSPEQRDKILGHQIYKVMVESLGGTSEYAAMERILEFAKSQEYEKIVVDTPPTHNAVDLLSAPLRLAEFMDNSVLKWFQSKPGLYRKVFQSGTKVALKFLRKLFGDEFLDTFTELMSELDGMQAGFKQRHLEVLSLLGAPESAFLLISRSTQERFEDAQLFQKSLDEHHLRLEAVILNKMEPAPPLLEDLGERLDETQQGALEDWKAYHQTLHDSQQKWASQFRSHFRHTAVIEIEDSFKPTHQLEILKELGRQILLAPIEAT